MLNITGRLEVQAGRQKASVVGEGSRIVVNVEDLGAFAREANMAGLNGRAIAKMLAGHLASAGLSLEVRTDGQAVLLLGREAKSGVLGWIAGISECGD